ncbi:MAG: hypothetical protein Q9220_003787 [cf. Caloplaca sp. 1 TL-2023]
MPLQGYRRPRIRLYQTLLSYGEVAEIHTASNYHPRPAHNPTAFPEPPESPLDAQEPAKFATKRRTPCRKLSSRLLGFIKKAFKGKSGLEDQCEEDIEDREAIELQDRWERMEGPNGLIQNLAAAVECMAETRLIEEYGGYLGVSLAGLKTRDFDLSDTCWKAQKLSWIEVGQVLQQEEEELRRLVKRPYDSMEDYQPIGQMTKDFHEAAKALNMNISPILFEIGEYTKRSLLPSHNRLRSLIDEAQWLSLAQTILGDKEKVKKFWGQDPQAKRQMMECIESVEKPWIYRCYWKHGHAFFFETEEASTRRICLADRYIRQRSVSTEMADSSSTESQLV